jgi:lipoprotein-releasing system permease protein
MSLPKPFASFERLLAWRYLRTSRREGFVSVIAGFSFVGILLGVATLIIVLSVMNGFRKELLNKIIGINGHIFVTALDSPLTDYDTLAERLREVNGVLRATPMIEGQAFASSPSAGGGVLVRGVRGEDLKHFPSIAGNLRVGDLNDVEEKTGVAIGKRLAEQLGITVGDTLTLVSPRGAMTAFGTAPRIKSYPVAAIFEIGMSEFDAAFVYMPLREAQIYFNKENDVSVIEVFVENADRIDALKPKLEEALQRPALITDWRQRNKTFFGALEVERNVMFLILTLIVLVAALNIVSGLIMLVKDKTSDIAILRTMGATRGAVMRIFLMTGGAIGVSGTLGGFALGVIVTTNIETIRQGISFITGANLFPAELYFLSKIPAEMNPAEVGFTVAFALALSFLATLYPAWRAAKLDPVQALRYG